MKNKYYNEAIGTPAPKGRGSPNVIGRQATKHPSISFTIVEMVIVIFIIGIISALTMANYRAGQKVRELTAETEKIASVLKRAQNMALTGYEISGSRVDRGYGVYITSSTYTLFADTSASQEYKYDAESEKIQSFNVASGITINSIGCADTVFKPPLGVVYCDGVYNFSGDKTFTILQTAENRYLYIRINSSGQISVSSN